MKKTSLSGRKGQVWIADAMISSAFFAIVLFIMLGTSQEIMLRVASARSDAGAKTALLLASDLLVLTPGTPADWENIPVLNDSNVNSLGLASSPNVISFSKAARLAALNSTNYTAIRGLLGLASGNLLVEISFMQNRSPIYRFGIDPANSTGVRVSERVAVLNGSLVLVRVGAESK
jgi:hypothetical protein